MYLIRKDGMWLIGYRPTGVRELVDGKLVDVSTCVWGSDVRDAMTWDHRVQAQACAKRFGGEVVAVKGGRK